MIWVLILTLATGVTGPVYVTEEACRLTEDVVRQGYPVSVQLEDDSIVEVVDARCEQQQMDDA